MQEVTIPTPQQGLGGESASGTISALAVQIYDVNGNTPQIPNGSMQVVVTGGTLNTTVSFSGSINTDIGSVKINDAAENFAVIGASWTNVDANSTALMDTSATAISGGSVVFSTLIASASAFQLPISNNLLNRLVITYSQLNNVADTLSLVCTSTAGASTTYGGITWKEIR